MKIHDLAPAPGAHRARRRVARGTAGKGGKTAGRGTKGQSARDTVPAGFEGGQLPLTQRIPKLRGKSPEEIAPAGMLRAFQERRRQARAASVEVS